MGARNEVIDRESISAQVDALKEQIKFGNWVNW
jgi:hypothetical protein